ESGALLAGDLSNTNIYLPEDTSTHRTVRTAFEEQVQWAVEAGVDFFIAETFSYLAEALLALEVIRETGLPSVVTLAIHQPGVTPDGATPGEACKALEDA